MSSKFASVLQRASDRGRTVLFEHELFDLLVETAQIHDIPTGHIAVPDHVFLSAKRSDFRAVEALQGRAGFVKVVSPTIAHKSDVGGIVALEAIDERSVTTAVERIRSALPEDLQCSIAGFLVEEKVPYEARLGTELMLGMRRSRAFGEVVTVGFGGAAVESLSEAMTPGQCNVLFHLKNTPREQRRKKLDRAFFFRWISGGARGVDALVEPGELADQIEYMLTLLDCFCTEVEARGWSVLELEINPLVWSRGEGLAADSATPPTGWIPVDGWMRFGPQPEQRVAPAEQQLRRALNPGSVAIVGVSRRMNVGRTILQCLIRGGYPRDRIAVVRRDGSPVDGVPCIAALTELQQRVDLLILAVGADRIPDLLEEVFATRCAAAVLLIPGGMGEVESGRDIERAILDLVQGGPSPGAARRPVLIGNNSLGILSQPRGAARFDTLFIPEEKLGRDGPRTADVALISQSGAFMITRASKLDFLSFRYQISVGNQIDVRLVDVLEALVDEDDLSTYALYIEGLKAGDGQRLCGLTRELTARGRDVIVYKGGRSRLGGVATAGHTASVAGDYRVFAELVRDSGALLADTFDEFLDLIQLSAAWNTAQLSGNRTAFLSNAGYEVVGMADRHADSGRELVLAVFSGETRERVRSTLKVAGIADLLAIHNPLDLTPMADDAVHEACIRAVLDDPGVDLAVLGNVPLSGALKTLPSGLREGDVFDATDGYARRLMRVFEQSPTPFAVVIDAGRLYDPLCRFLQEAGLAVFRSADRAVNAIGAYMMARLE